MKLKNLGKLEAQWYVLLVALLAYTALYFASRELFGSASHFFWKAFKDILPIMVVVFGLIFVSNIFMKAEIIAKYLGKSSKLKGWSVAILGGIASSGPIYMWFPLLADLKEKGAKNSFIVAFLYTRSIKIPLMPLMLHYFTWPFVVVLTVYTIIFSIVNGLVFEKIMNSRKEVGGL